MRNKINKVVVLPRRDWRFWAALCAFGGILVVAAAFWAQIKTNTDLSADNDRLVAQVDTQSTQQECRSRAAVFTEDVDIQADSLLARSLVAAVSDVDIEPTTDGRTPTNGCVGWGVVYPLVVGMIPLVVGMVLVVVVVLVAITTQDQQAA